MRHPSVRARLTAWYAATLLAAFTLAVLGLRTALADSLAASREASLLASGRLVSGFFRVELAEFHAADSTVAHMAMELVFPERLVEFLPPEGQAPLHPRLVVAQPTVLPPLRTVELPLDPDLAPGWRVRIVGSSAADVALLRRMDLWFGLLLLASMLVSTVGGWWLAGRALRPVRAMADAAGRITADHSSERLPVGPVRDEFARLGQRFNALLDRLDGALAQQRRFLADAAHELRTPVARMRGEVELALDPRAADALAPRETLERMRDDLNDAGRLVDELLQLARADAGGQDVHLAPAYLDDVVMEAAAGWRAAAARRDVAITLTALEEAPALLDAPLVRRLVGILVDNAIRYTPAGGHISISVRREPAAARLEVADSGIGMTADERVHAFERFYRGARARQLTPEGSGLGLAIAEWVARRHGAAITLDAAQPTGTIVRVRFPLADAASTASATSAAPTPGRTSEPHGAAR